MNQQTESYNLKSEEKLLALFSHLSLFIGGIFLPIIFWIVNKDKSKFVTFHSMQAFFFHIAYIIIIFVFVFGLAIAGIGLGIFSAAASHGHSEPAGGLFVILIIAFYAFLFVYIFGSMAYVIYMGIKAYNGELKKYPIIGNLVYKSVYLKG